MLKFLTLTACILLPLAVGGISTFLAGPADNEWYRELVKPAINPPGWVFGPVWTLIYLLMGVSFYLVINAKKGPDRTRAIQWYFLQLFLNFMWSLLFFRWHQVALAFSEIIILWIAIMMMIMQFAKVDRTAWKLQIPYLLWVTFATFLSGSFWWLNCE